MIYEYLKMDFNLTFCIFFLCFVQFTCGLNSILLRNELRRTCASEIKPDLVIEAFEDMPKEMILYDHLNLDYWFLPTYTILGLLMLTAVVIQRSDNTIDEIS